MSTGLVELYRARDTAEAHCLRLQLEDHGIYVVVDNEILQGGIGELPMGWSTALRLLVPAESVSRAGVLLNEFLVTVTARQLLSDDDRCLHCGDLMADFDKCPKCGWTFLASDSQRADDGVLAASHGLTAMGWQKLGREQSQVAEVDKTSAIAISSTATERVTQHFDRASIHWEVLTMLAVYVLPMSYFAASDWYLGGHERVPFVVQELGQLVSSIAGVCGALFVISRSGEHFAAFGIDYPHRKDLATGCLIACVLWFSMSLTWQFLASPSADFHQEFVFSLPSKPWHYGILVVSLLASSCFEELLVRGYLLTRFEQLWGSKVSATVVASGLFAAWHVYQGADSVHAAFVFGVTLSVIYFANRRLWPLIIGHALYNLVVWLHWQLELM